MSDDIIAGIDELIEKTMERHPPRPPPPAKVVPKAGTRIQRSDRQTQAKWQDLLATPPPLPSRKPTVAVSAVRAHEPPAVTQPGLKAARRRKITIRPAPPALIAATKPTSAPALVYGPAPPPPIQVEYAPGRTTAVPYFAATRSRIFKLRTTKGRWKLRFNHDGKLLSSRPIPVPHALLS
jgi:hypothetical protein